MKVKLNISPLEVIDGTETIEVECVFDVLTIRRYEAKDCWLIYCSFWWEHLFNEKFNTAEEAIKFIEMRCEQYIDEVLEWIAPNASVQEK